MVVGRTSMNPKKGAAASVVRTHDASRRHRPLERGDDREVAVDVRVRPTRWFAAVVAGGDRILAVVRIRESAVCRAPSDATAATRSET
jgi:hypothetical protein